MADFYRLHSAEHQAGWCFCAAWWVPTWQGWGERSADENREVRQALSARGVFDGYLLYHSSEPVGWCQVGPRDRLEKLVRQLNLTPDASTWAITCFLIAPAYRRQGLAKQLLDGVLDELRSRRVSRVEAYPKRLAEPEAEDLWNGPESLFLQAGFQTWRDDPARPVLFLDLKTA